MHAQLAKQESPKSPPRLQSARIPDRNVTGLLASPRPTQELKAGQILFAEGDDAERVFEVVQGLLKLYKLLSDGRCQIMGFVSAERMIGFAHEGGYFYTAQAITEVSVNRYTTSQFYRLIDEVPDFARRILAAQCRNLRSAQNHMMLLGRKTALEKVSSFLLYLSKLSGTGYNSVHVPMTRGDIADYLGLTVETVSRSLTTLKCRNVISLPSNEEIRFLDRRRLEELAAVNEPTV